MTTKAPDPQKHDGEPLRVAIVHARWNLPIVEPLVEGAKQKLLECGVKESSIAVQSVPGSWELPMAVQRLFAASQVQGSSSGNSLTAGDLLGSSTSDLTSLPLTMSSSSAADAPPTPSGPFDAIIAIGVLIKGETMHFEYIADAVSQGLMRVQLDTGVPVVFGVLTVLDEEQAWTRAGRGGETSSSAHNHGHDWGLAAVELGAKRKAWAAGKIE